MKHIDEYVSHSKSISSIDEYVSHSKPISFIDEYLLSKKHNKISGIDENSSAQDIIEWLTNQGVPYKTGLYSHFPKKGELFCQSYGDGLGFDLKIFPNYELQQVGMHYKVWKFEYYEHGYLESKVIDFNTAFKIMNQMINDPEKEININKFK